MKKMDPQKKKELSLKHDGRNLYGENSSASRKGIRRRKKWVNQTYRRAVKQSLATDADPDTLAEGADRVRRKDWKKVTDTPLGEVLLIDMLRDVEHSVWQAQQQDPLFLDSLRQRLSADGMVPTELHVVVRRLRAVARDRNSARLQLDTRCARRVQAAIHQLKESEQGIGGDIQTAPECASDAPHC